MSKPTFFMMAEAGKRVTAAWWGVPLIILFFFVGSAIGGIVFFALLGAGLLQDDVVLDIENYGAMMASFNSTTQGIYLFLTFVFCAIPILVWILVFEKRSLASFGLGNFGPGLVKFARGSVLAIAIMAVMTYGLSAMGMVESTAPAVPANWTMVWPLLVLLLGWTVQGSTEELAARGLLFQSAGARHGLIVAFIVSSAIFTLAHGSNENVTPLFLLNLVLYSIFIGFYALREASLWGICGYHAMWNFAQGNIFGFAVSGSYIGADRLMTSTSTGPVWITGGDSGLEGGVVTIVGLALSTVAVLTIKPDTHAKEIAHVGEENAAARQKARTEAKAAKAAAKP